LPAPTAATTTLASNAISATEALLNDTTAGVMPQLNGTSVGVQQNVTIEQNSEVTPTAAAILRTMTRTLSVNEESQTYSLSDQLQQDMEDDDDLLTLNLDVSKEEQSPAGTGNHGVLSDWDNISPNQVMARLKLLKAEVLDQHNLRPFYKSYSNWEKMSADQRNKAVAWFCKLPEPLKGNAFNFFHSFLIFMYVLVSRNTN
jgi:hypothetical protein